MGDQLGSDVNKIGANEEDSSINIVSDGEDPGYHAASPRHDLQKDTSASKKKMHVVQDIAENPKRGALFLHIDCHLFLKKKSFIWFKISYYALSPSNLSYLFAYLCDVSMHSSFFFVVMLFMVGGSGVKVGCDHF